MNTTTLIGTICLSTAGILAFVMIARGLLYLYRKGEYDVLTAFVIVILIIIGTILICI